MVYEQSVFKMGYSHPGKRKGQGAKEKTLTKTACFGGGCSEMCLGVFSLSNPFMLIFKQSLLFKVVAMYGYGEG